MALFNLDRLILFSGLGPSLNFLIVGTCLIPSSTAISIASAVFSTC